MKPVRPLVILGVAATCALTLAGCGGDSPDATPTPGRSIGTATDQKIPQHIMDMPLTDADGHTVHLSDYHGKTIVISDSMTLCQESCPLDTATTVQTARDENEDGHRHDIVYLSITVDPARDTVPQIAAYRKLYTPTPSNWHVLTGDVHDIHALWKYFGVWWKKTPNDEGPTPKNWRTGKPLTHDIAHSDNVFFIDPHGHERFVLAGMPAAKKSQIPSKIYRFMNDEGHENLSSPPKTAWTEGQARQVLDWLTHDA